MFFITCTCLAVFKLPASALKSRGNVIQSNAAEERGAGKSRTDSLVLLVGRRKNEKEENTMKDNRSAFISAEYDQKILQTVPYYQDILIQVAELVEFYFPQPVSWLDTGCGTGNVIQIGAQRCRIQRAVLCDPSSAMLELSREKLKDCPFPCTYRRQTSQQICEKEEYDVITAVQAHHYLSGEERILAARQCCRALKPHGLFILVENYSPSSQTGIQLGLKRWQGFQTAHGKSESSAQEHVNRFGVEYFPITPTRQKEMLGQCGFQQVELFWLSYLQAGFYAIK